ncbi:uro-adherence factor A-like [Watersipora subatra]|uniref:uro-adherence factor A-like n=1 Tax=Watersipora subatra TaxID=2589382 RepID=UPI00355C4E09
MSSDQLSESWQKKIEKNGARIPDNCIQNRPTNLKFGIKNVEGMSSTPKHGPLNTHIKGQHWRGMHMKNYSTSIHHPGNVPSNPNILTASKPFRKSTEFTKAINGELPSCEVKYKTCYSQRLNKFDSNAENFSTHSSELNHDKAVKNWKWARKCLKDSLAEPQKQQKGGYLTKEYIANNSSYCSKNFPLSSSESLSISAKSSNSATNSLSNFGHQTVNRVQSPALNKTQQKPKSFNQSFYCLDQQTNANSSADSVTDLWINRNSSRKNDGIRVKDSDNLSEASMLTQTYERKKCEKTNKDLHLKYTKAQQEAATILDLAYRSVDPKHASTRTRYTSSKQHEEAKKNQSCKEKRNDVESLEDSRDFILSDKISKPRTLTKKPQTMLNKQAKYPNCQKSLPAKANSKKQKHGSPTTSKGNTVHSSNSGSKGLNYEEAMGLQVGTSLTSQESPKNLTDQEPAADIQKIGTLNSEAPVRAKDAENSNNEKDLSLTYKEAMALHNPSIADSSQRNDVTPDDHSVTEKKNEIDQNSSTHQPTIEKQNDHLNKDSSLTDQKVHSYQSSNKVKSGSQDSGVNYKSAEQLAQRNLSDDAVVNAYKEGIIKSESTYKRSSIENISHNNVKQVTYKEQNNSKSQEKLVNQNKRDSVNKHLERRSSLIIPSLTQIKTPSSKLLANSKENSVENPKKTSKSSTSQKPEKEDQHSADDNVTLAKDKKSDMPYDKEVNEHRELGTNRASSAEIPKTGTKSKDSTERTKSGSIPHQQSARKSREQQVPGTKKHSKPLNHSSSKMSEEDTVEEPKPTYKHSEWSNASQFQPVVSTNKNTAQETKSVDRKISSQPKLSKVQSNDTANKVVSSSGSDGMRAKSITSKKADSHDAAVRSQSETNNAKKSSSLETKPENKKPSITHQSGSIGNTDHLLEVKDSVTKQENVAGIDMTFKEPSNRNLEQKSENVVDKSKLTPSNKQGNDPMSDPDTFESAESYLSDKYDDPVLEPLPED